MIPNITRGSRMSGSCITVASTDTVKTKNAHTDPHVVAGEAAVMAWNDVGVLDKDDAVAIAKHRDQPRKAFGRRGAAERIIQGFQCPTTSSKSPTVSALCIDSKTKCFKRGSASAASCQIDIQDCPRVGVQETLGDPRLTVLGWRPDVRLGCSSV